MESFYTIQGEGFHQGKAAYFVRLAGCDVGCVWCDVKESWDLSKHPVVEIKKIIDDAKQYSSRMAVITGGEPLMHNLTELTDQFHSSGFRTHIETSGAYVLSGSWDWICLSPKKFKKPIEGICNLANELKVVVYNKSDFDWAEDYKSKMNANCKLYLQPEWSRESEMKQLIVDYIKQNPEWEISLQIHKYLNIP